MVDNLNQAIDNFYSGKELLPETIKIIGTALLREQQGKTPEQIGAELGLSPEQARGVVVRSRGWEETEKLEQEKQRRSRYSQG
jgi:hypothetical protein